MKKLLANLIIYRSNIQTIHWKMRGVNFLSVHKLTDKMYEEINEFIDRIVEKHVQKNIEIATDLTGLMQVASIKEEIKLDIEVHKGITKLIADSKDILLQVENSYGDIKHWGAMDLVLDDLREYLEKTTWMLSKSL